MGCVSTLFILPNPSCTTLSLLIQCTLVTHRAVHARTASRCAGTRSSRRWSGSSLARTLLTTQRRSRPGQKTSLPTGASPTSSCTASLKPSTTASSPSSPTSRADSPLGAPGCELQVFLRLSHSCAFFLLSFPKRVESQILTRLPRPQPTADPLFLHAHDAQQSPSSRFARFRAFIHGLVIVYKVEAASCSHDPGAVARLKAVEDALASPQQARAFAALALELQVSAVDNVRELVFDACKRVHAKEELLASDRLVRPWLSSSPLPSRLSSARPETDARCAQVKLIEAAFLGHEPAVAAPAGFVSVRSSSSHGPLLLVLDLQRAR